MRPQNYVKITICAIHRALIRFFSPITMTRITHLSCSHGWMTDGDQCRWRQTQNAIRQRDIIEGRINCYTQFRKQS